MILTPCLFSLASHWQNLWIQYLVGGPEVEEEQWAPSAHSGHAGNIRCQAVVAKQQRWPRHRQSRGTKQKRDFREEERANHRDKERTNHSCQALSRAITNTRPGWGESTKAEIGICRQGVTHTSPQRQMLTSSPQWMLHFCYTSLKALYLSQLQNIGWPLLWAQRQDEAGLILACAGKTGRDGKVQWQSGQWSWSKS